MRVNWLLGSTLVACAASPPPAPRAETDAATVLTAAGVESAHGLTWPPDIRAQPARRTFKNVRVLRTVTSERFMAAMQSMQANVGLQCRDCHLRDDFPSDELPRKVRAREMLKMTARINLDLFGGAPAVTCFTCHLGKPAPEKPALPAAAQPTTPPPPPAAADAERPSSEVYGNVQVFDDVPAGKLVPIMSWFTQWLGVSCTHCHVEGKWSADEKATKRRARQMLLMSSDVARLFYKGSSPVGCATCHRGGQKPARAPSDLHDAQQARRPRP